MRYSTYAWGTYAPPKPVYLHRRTQVGQGARAWQRHFMIFLQDKLQARLHRRRALRVLELRQQHSGTAAVVRSRACQWAHSAVTVNQFKDMSQRAARLQTRRHVACSSMNRRDEGPLQPTSYQVDVMTEGGTCQTPLFHPIRTLAGRNALPLRT